MCSVQNLLFTFADIMKRYSGERYRAVMALLFFYCNFKSKYSEVLTWMGYRNICKKKILFINETIQISVVKRFEKVCVIHCILLLIPYMSMTEARRAWVSEQVEVYDY